MKIKGNIFGKTLKTVAIAFVFMLCSNTNAATSNTNTVSLNLDAISTTSHLASANVYALTGSWWNNFFRGNKCKRHHRRNCRICKGGNNNGSHDSGSHDSGSHDSGSHDSVPLDGGLSILLLGAAAFGVKKLRNKK